MQTEHELLKQLYAAFNARDIDRCLGSMHPDVTWANGMEGGSVYGHDAVRDYWTRQWKLINPRVDPLHFKSDGNRVAVDVHQVVHALDGSLLFDQTVKHVFTFDQQMVKVFEIA